MNSGKLLLKHMKKFLNKEKPEKTEDKLSSPLWYNKYITSEDFYLADWYKKGITTPSDLLNENIEIHVETRNNKKIQNNNN